MNQSIKLGNGPYGFAFMKFALTYEGELRSRDIPARTWEIRKQISPQLEELWRIHPVLQQLERDRYVPLTSSFFYLERHHSLDENRHRHAPNQSQDCIDLCAVHAVGNRQFLPLVRDTLALKCGLKILFMRKEEPGRVYQGGDMDNRLKTLFDALTVPKPEQIVDDPGTPDPIYCLLQDDGMITALNVETQRLLTNPNASKHEVRLIIEVDVRVTQTRTYNQRFLGD